MDFSSISHGNFIPGLGPGERFVENWDSLNTSSDVGDDNDTAWFKQRNISDLIKFGELFS